MSIALMSIVWKLRLPPGEKLVLLALADQANDEGKQCWPSVDTIAERSGQGERTVRRALASLASKGHLTIYHRDGTSSQYHVHPCQNGTPAKSAPLPKTTKTPAKLAPKTSRNINNRKKDARELPDDWKPVEFGPETQSRKLVDGWPPGLLAERWEAFVGYHRAKGSKFVDWQAAWSTWVLNTRKFNNDNAVRATGSQGGNRSNLAKAIDEGLDWLG